MSQPLQELSPAQERSIKKLERDMGVEMLTALHDSRTVEVMLNADGKIWLERLGEGMKCIGSLRRAQGQAIIETVAGYLGKEVTRHNSLLEGVFPLDGSRFAGSLPPTSLAPTFAIRKRPIVIYTLDNYVERGIMTAHQRDVILKAVRDHRNILIVGGTGSGKTTLVNAVISAMVDMQPTERIFIIEDTAEIQCKAENRVQMHTTLEHNMTHLLRMALRMRPDRILVGEVRGPEALDMLMAWNTGHEGGVATLHANNVHTSTSRLAMLISMNPEPPKPVEPLIAEAVHVIVHIVKRPDRTLFVPEIIEVKGYENGKYITQPL